MSGVKHFLTLSDVGARGTLSILEQAHALKRARREGADQPQILKGKTVAILLEKSSTRTRISFAVGVHDLGGTALTLPHGELQLGRGEPIDDTARMLSRYLDMVVYRTSAHARAAALANASTIPVVNGLTDLHHPCQLLADLQTVQEAFGADLSQQTVAWIGDGNNMAHSWIEAASLLGFHVRVATPKGYEPDKNILSDAQTRFQKDRRGSVTLTHDPREAVRGATVVTTDVWASMGQESEAEARKRAFAGYCVDDAMMKLADREAIFLHCLPAHRGEEVTASILEGASSRVWDEAENRLHAQKALMVHLMARPK